MHKQNALQGKLTRLINCLCGFDEDVQIKIADNEQISNVLSIIRNKYVDDQTFNNVAHLQLKEMGYDSLIIEEWLV